MAQARILFELGEFHSLLEGFEGFAKFFFGVGHGEVIVSERRHEGTKARRHTGKREPPSFRAVYREESWLESGARSFASTLRMTMTQRTMKLPATPCMVPIAATPRPHAEVPSRLVTI